EGRNDDSEDLVPRSQQCFKRTNRQRSLRTEVDNPHSACLEVPTANSYRNPGKRTRRGTNVKPSSPFHPERRSDAVRRLAGLSERWWLGSAELAHFRGAGGT